MTRMKKDDMPEKDGRKNSGSKKSDQSSDKRSKSSDKKKESK